VKVLKEAIVPKKPTIIVLLTKINQRIPIDLILLNLCLVKKKGMQYLVPKTNKLLYKISYSSQTIVIGSILKNNFRLFLYIG